MARKALLLCLAICVGSASADRLVLRDGRSFDGVVTVLDDAVEIELAYGTIRFLRDQVRRIEFKETPEAQLSQKLATVPSGDVETLFAVARWAQEQGLDEKAKELYKRILKTSPNHAATRCELGHMKIDGQWREFDASLELARGKLQAGHYQVLLDDILPILIELAKPRRKTLAVTDILAYAQLRSGLFAQATANFEALAAKSPNRQAIRYGAIVEILKRNADGMYVLAEPYPPKATILSAEAGPALRPGAASLSRPLVLKAALRDRAKEQIVSGRALLEAARSLEASDPDAAKAKYFQAEKCFNRADAMVPDIARSYRVEIARRRIAAIRNETQADARNFDASMAKLGNQDLSAKDYHTMVLRMIRQLDDVRGKLGTIQTIAKPFPNDLVLEVQWAKADLKKIESMRQVLAAEVEGER